MTTWGGSLIESVSYGVFRDEGIVLGTILVMIVADLLRPRDSSSPAGVIFLLGASVALAFNLLWPQADANLWGGAFVVDGFSRFFKSLFLGAAALVTLSSLGVMRDHPARGEFYAFLGASTLGMMLLAGAGELIAIFVALEMTSISLYLMAAMEPGETRSREAGLKYLLIGAFSTALLVFGLSYVYAACGATDLAGIRAMARAHPDSGLLLAGLVLVLAGLGFKIAAAPFHMWAPDVYQGAPIPMVAFASVASKAAGFAVMIRVLIAALPALSGEWSLLLAVMAALTMLIGSLVAIPQTDVKRLLAYSSIAQAGYLLIGFVTGSAMGVSAVLYYLVVYVFTNVAAFIVVMVHARHTGNAEIAGLSGLSRRAPLLALVFLLSLLSLAGIPPLGGFVGKLYLFAAAMEQSASYLWLVVTGVLLSIVSLFYYLQVIRQMYIEAPHDEAPVSVGPAATTALAICVVGILVTGIWPSLIMETTDAVAAATLSSLAGY